MMINMTSILHCRGHNYWGTVIELPPCASETRRHTREQIEIMSNEAAQCPAEVSIFRGRQLLAELPGAPESHFDRPSALV